MQTAEAQISVVDGVSTWSANCPCCDTECTWQIKASEDDLASVIMACPTCESEDCQTCSQDSPNPETDTITTKYQFEATRP